jgi:hypothetical protein
MAAASLGSATGSRVDSAAKHTMACKIDSNFLKRTFDTLENSEELLNQNKMKYAMQKDEIVMNTSKKFFATSGHAAYPLVITTLGDIDDTTQNFLKKIYSSTTLSDFIKYSSKNEKERFILHNRDSKMITTLSAHMPEFRCQGVALGQAFASHLTGDTVATVLVGGMATVMNGAFEMFAGDEVQWYFGFEQNDFALESNQDYRQGQRRVNDRDERVTEHVAKRMRFNDARLMGSQTGLGNKSGFKNSNSIFRIKSYQPYIVDIGGVKIATTHYGDKVRVFAKCITGGRPGDMVDIMICTQSS